jgi:hypothetical protein
MMKQMIEMKSMTNIHKIDVETRRMMNIQLIVYKIAQIFQMIDKISKNEIEMIVWALISFLMMNDKCRDFAVFLKFLMKKFLAFLFEIKMKEIVWENFLLLTIREIDISLMIVEVIFLSEVIVLSMIDLEMMILEI